MSNNEMALRMECLRLACATSDVTNKANEIVLKAQTFEGYVQDKYSGVILPKIVQQ